MEGPAVGADRLPVNFVMDDWQLWMYATRNQQTIAAAASVEGIGYWSGREVRVEFRPAAADTGIVFIRSDLEGYPAVAATVSNRTETPLRTTLCRDGVGVDMIEHVMAALAGLQVDNCQVVTDEPELPGCDGSSMPFVDALCAAEIVPQDAVRCQRVIRRKIRLGTEESWIEARPCPPGMATLRYELDYGSGGPIAAESLEISLSPEAFREELAPSRTFMLQHEAVALQARGLGRRTTYRDLLVFGPDGPIDNRLRFPDECVRHKLVDMVGDLALAGCDLIGRIMAHRSGHRLNAELVRAVLDRVEVQEGLKYCA